jgi:hypothetical protein
LTPVKDHAGAATFWFGLRLTEWSFRMKVFLLILIAASIIVTALMLRPGANLRAEYDKRRLALTSGGEGAVLTEEDIAHLPPPVQKYIARAGAVGKPRVTLVHAVFDATLYRSPGSSGMSGQAHQIDVIDPPRRLFFMQTRMFGLPVAVLHDYDVDRATMRVRLAGLFDVVNISGPQLSKAETVTILDDLAAFAPSALAGPKFTWKAVDASQAEVTFHNGAYTVSAVLKFNIEGDLIDFHSSDRGELQDDGTLKILHWSTPLSDYRDFGGRRAPGRGEAVYHRPDGPFAYGRFALTSLRFNEAER